MMPENIIHSHLFKGFHYAFTALTLLVGCLEGHQAWKTLTATIPKFFLGRPGDLGSHG